jgi:hypothetical protein
VQVPHRAHEEVQGVDLSRPRTTTIRGAPPNPRPPVPPLCLRVDDTVLRVTCSATLAGIRLSTMTSELAGQGRQESVFRIYAHLSPPHASFSGLKAGAWPCRCGRGRRGCARSCRAGDSTQHRALVSGKQLRIPDRIGTNNPLRRSRKRQATPGEKRFTR